MFLLNQINKSKQKIKNKIPSLINSKCLKFKIRQLTDFEIELFIERRDKLKKFVIKKIVNENENKLFNLSSEYFQNLSNIDQKEKPCGILTKAYPFLFEHITL